MVHHQQYDFAESRHISSELRHHQYGQARHELISELHHHPREFQHLLHQVSNDLIKHHQHPLNIEHDRHNNITHINFHHHNIYSAGVGHGHESSHHESHRHRHHEDEATGDTSHRNPYGHHQDGHYGEHHHGEHHQDGHHGEHHQGGYHPRSHDGRNDQLASSRAPAHDARDNARPNEGLSPGEIQNPFVNLANGVEKGLDQAGQAIGDAAHEIGKGIGDAARDIGNGLESISRAVGDKMARLADEVAKNLHAEALEAHRLDPRRKVTGDCAHGPRLVFDKMGYHLPQMMATEQGRHVRESGLFDEVWDVRPGDYGVRNWSKHVIAQNGGRNPGDSFIVDSVHKGVIHQANDHFQNIDTRGRYADVHFYRPNARFLAMMQEKGLV